MENNTNIRIYLDSPLASGTIIELDAKQVNYLKNVMRMKVSDRLTIFNGEEGEWLAKINEIAKKQGCLSVIEKIKDQQPCPDIWLVFAPIKHGKIDFLAQKATELGVAALLPMFTRHTSVNRVNTERLRANAIEAAEQSERTTVPEVKEAQNMEEILKNWDKNRKILLCDESGGGVPINEALKDQEKGKPWAIFIGPEGGFAKAELDMLRKLPYVISVGMGPRILRADTAAISALSCWQSIVGDWQKKPDFKNEEQ